MSKLYFWDWSEVENEGARFENVVAFHLKKYCDFLTDIGYSHLDLQYLKSKSHKEIDFILVKDKKPWLPIEVKLSDDKPSKHWPYFLSHLPCNQAVQVVRTPGVFKIYYIEDKPLLIISADHFLAYLA